MVKCPICGKTHKNKIFCSVVCRRKDVNYNFSKPAGGNSGGYRRGSGRGKGGWYQGIYCDSTWELAYVIWAKDNKKEIIRNKETFSYYFDGKDRKFLPDFVVDGDLIEIKGYKSKQWEAKISQFPQERKIDVLYKKEMKPILEYAIEQHGETFYNLYE
jgi:hypothetical protein